MRTPSEREAWSIVLAGADATRTFGHATLARQYFAPPGGRSLLERTLDRSIALIPPERTITLIGSGHQPFAAPQVSGRSDHVLRLPTSSDPGIGVLYPLAFVRHWAPHAVVVVMPGNRVATPANAFVFRIAEALAVAWQNPGSVVLLGDTQVFCGTVESIWNLGRETQPELMRLADQLVAGLSGPQAEMAVRDFFVAAQRLNWQSDVLARAPDLTLTLTLRGIDWVDSLPISPERARMLA